MILIWAFVDVSDHQRVSGDEGQTRAALPEEEAQPSADAGTAVSV